MKIKRIVENPFRKRVNRIEEDNKILLNELKQYQEFIKKYKAEKLFNEFKHGITA